MALTDEFTYLTSRDNVTVFLVFSLRCGHDIQVRMPRHNIFETAAINGAAGLDYCPECFLTSCFRIINPSLTWEAYFHRAIRSDREREVDAIISNNWNDLFQSRTTQRQ